MGKRGNIPQKKMSIKYIHIYGVGNYSYFGLNEVIFCLFMKLAKEERKEGRKEEKEMLNDDEDDLFRFKCL